MVSASMPTGEAIPRMLLEDWFACRTSPFGPKNKTPHERFDKTAALMFSELLARRCSSSRRTANSCFCCFNCWMTAWYACKGSCSGVAAMAGMASCSPILLRSRRMMSAATTNANPEANSSNAILRKIGLVSNFTAASSTNLGTASRRKSGEPSITSQELLAEEECEHRHAAQKDSERHLVMPVHRLRGVPGAPAGVMKRQVAPLDESARALYPDHQDRAHAENRAGNRRSEDRKHCELHSQKRSDHGHELDVAEAHAFNSTRAQVDRARAIDE